MPQQEELVERIIKVDYIPANNKANHHIYAQTYFPEELTVAPNEPVHSFGSSFGPICYHNSSGKSIFEVKEPSFSNSHV